MSDSKNVTVSFGGLWFLMFIIIKVAGTAFASWSWLWILLPIVPDVVYILHRMGVVV